MRSKYACPNSKLFAISNAINRNADLFGFVLIFFGFYLTFISYKYSDLTQILVGVIFINFISVYFILNYLNAELFYNQNKLISWCIISFLIGLAIGFLFANSLLICSMTLGGFTGYLLTQIIMQSIIILVTRYPNIIFWVIFIFLLSLCIYLGMKFKKHFFIIYSCFLGAYGIVRVNINYKISNKYIGHRSNRT